MDNSSRKKLLFVITKSNWGGAQRYVYDLATGLKKKGFDVQVAYGGTGAADAQEGTLSSNLRKEGIGGIFVQSFMRDISFFREFKVLRELVSIYKRERPHVVHLNSSKAGGVGSVAGRLARVPRIVFTSHGLAYDEDRGPLMRAYLWLLTWLTFLFCHEVILISKDSYERARRFPFCAHKVHLIYNGIPDMPRIPREDARTKLLATGRTDVPWIGTISELTKNKGVSYLIDAARLLTIRGQEFVLCIVGGGEEHDTFAQRIQGYGLSDCVHLLGFVPEAACYLTAFDIFTLTSVKEGHPYVLLEAAQASCAVVASRIPGITDIVTDVSGVLVSPKNAVTIADALQELLKSPDKRRTFGTALRMDVENRFPIERMLEETVRLYDSHA